MPEKTKLRFKPGPREKLGIFSVSGYTIDLSDGKYHSINTVDADKLIDMLPECFDVKVAQTPEELGLVTPDPDPPVVAKKPVKEKVEKNPDLEDFKQLVSDKYATFTYKEIIAKAEAKGYTGDSRKRVDYVAFLIELAVKEYLAPKI